MDWLMVLFGIQIGPEKGKSYTKLCFKNKQTIPLPIKIPYTFNEDVKQFCQSL